MTTESDRSWEHHPPNKIEDGCRLQSRTKLYLQASQKLVQAPNIDIYNYSLPVLYFVCDANYRIDLAGDTQRVVMGEGPFR